MPHRLPILLVLAALLAPTASAGLLAPTEVAPSPGRAGDLLEYATSVDGQPGLAFRVLVEGPAEARDRYGLERATEAYLAQHFHEDRLVAAHRCHALADGLDAVAVEPLKTRDALAFPAIAMPSMGLPGAPSVTVSEQALATFPRTGCPGRLPARAFVEGERVPLEALIPGASPSIVSEPARAVAFKGRAALAFHFHNEAKNETFVVTVADGLPGIARVAGETVAQPVAGGTCRYASDNLGRDRTGACTWKEHEGAPRSFVVELMAFAPGSGAPLGDAREGRSPLVNPVAAPRSYDGRFFETAHLDLLYPLEEAASAIASDPSLYYGEFMKKHPGAILAYAHYDRRMRLDETPDARTRGGWELVFAAGEAFYVVKSVRLASAPGPLAAAHATRNAEFKVGWRAERFSIHDIDPPARFAPSAALADAAKRYGIAPGAIERLEYAAPSMSILFLDYLRGPPSLVLSDVSGVALGLSEGATPLTSERTSEGGPRR